MSVLTTYGSTALAAFMASTVEFVEALTIVLAVGVVRGWRSALLGTGAGVGVLIALILAFGSSLSAVPLALLQAGVGTLLLLFGLRWLRNAILRAAGVLASHDEAATFAAQAAALGAPHLAGRSNVDKVALVTAFKAVVLEGIEVVFIVVAMGAGGTLLLPAAAGAALALSLVVLLGALLRRPLSSIPENTLKFGVGVALAAFGCFWVAEGLGWAWPGGDTALWGLIAVFAAVALGLVAAARRLHHRRRPQAGFDRAPQRQAVTERPGALAVMAREAWGLFVDDGWLAAGILGVLGGAVTLAHGTNVSSAVEHALLVGALVAVLSASALRRAAQ